MLVSLPSDLGKFERGWGDSPRKKMSALRWGIFTMIYAAAEAFFNDVLAIEGSTRALPLKPDTLREVGNRCGVKLFTRDWRVRTRVKGNPRGGGIRSRWATYEGVQQMRNYLLDMKRLHDILSPGGDPF